MAPGAGPPPSRGGASQGDQPIPATTIRWWAGGAAAFAGLDVLAWVTGYPVLGVVLALLGVLAVGVALLERRRNRWLDQAARWNTGHHHDFPPAGREEG